MISKICQKMFEIYFSLCNFYLERRYHMIHFYVWKFFFNKVLYTFYIEIRMIFWYYSLRRSFTRHSVTCRYSWTMLILVGGVFWSVKLLKMYENFLLKKGLIKGKNSIKFSAKRNVIKLRFLFIYLITYGFERKSLITHENLRLRTEEFWQEFLWGLLFFFFVFFSFLDLYKVER